MFLDQSSFFCFLFFFLYFIVLFVSRRRLNFNIMLYFLLLEFFFVGVCDFSYQFIFRIFFIVSIWYSSFFPFFDVSLISLSEVVIVRVESRVFFLAS